jgi:hypothetical protein
VLGVGTSADEGEIRAAPAAPRRRDRDAARSSAGGARRVNAARDTLLAALREPR